MRKNMEYSMEKAAELIIQAGNRLVEKGLIARTWGNISARISDTEFMITPSGMAYDRLTPDKLVVCKIEDCSYGGNIRPSSEKGVHGEAYKYRKDISFVIHTHQLYATAVGAMGESVTGRDEIEREILGKITPVAKYAISSTEPLKRNVSNCIQAHPDSNAFLMRYHGVLALGKDDKCAFQVAETLEEICRDLVENKSGISAQQRFDFLPEHAQEEINAAIRNICGYSFTVYDASPVVRAASQSEKKVRPMIDDMAQIAGASFACVDPDRGSLAEKIVKGFGKNNVVFVRGLGAVCAADTQDEVEAVAMVLEKNCLAAVYCASQGRAYHLSLPDAMLQRNTYVKKYSKLK